MTGLLPSLPLWLAALAGRRQGVADQQAADQAATARVVQAEREADAAPETMQDIIRDQEDGKW